MDTQRHEVVKLPTVSATKFTTLSSYFIRTIEIFKSIISHQISQDAIASIIGVLIAAAIIFFLLVLGNIPNGFKQPIYQLSQFSGNIEITADYYRQAILSDYLKTMTKVILEDNPKKVQNKSAIFRAMTQAVLQELDPECKRYIIMFLQDANLLRMTSNKQPSLLLGANLTGANLQGMNLRFANLQGTNLSRVDLRSSDLLGANFTDAIFNNSCYNNFTIFDKNFQPQAAGMRKVKSSKKC
ncbi:pentapeptide repeat-containing protein [Dendronalium sp. ChiSLP03b]|uniref:pentapeptide repeat-containing protein n=1 Tax=Dendronalium sp. ChiSLP03b TaxID=3075381 RepID=UPI002AD52AA8|nr:pentapeptide repeat-containing protein [Dendronalium sp. ChiSLP03b]MDZ8205316.1 pentapeptide repeat-containing protein [Dendronalium sp. ChiSLP03b]